MSAKHLVIIAGPTAVGKTSLAISLAGKLNTEIINADSRQVYREMRIGTAVPSEEQLSAIKHHCVMHKSIHEPYNASMYEMEVLEILEALFERKNIVIITGGSGMYLDAVCRGIDDIPQVDQEVRKMLVEQFEEGGLEGIRQKLKSVDPEYYERVDLNNAKRILKALEISEMTHRPYSSFLTGRAKKRNFRCIKAGLDMQRGDLHNRINERVDAMMDAGLLEEARQLFGFKHLNALNTVGYKELFEFMESKHSLQETINRIKAHTRQYARRQLTWFRKDPDLRWFHPSDIHGLSEYIGRQTCIQNNEN